MTASTCFSTYLLFYKSNIDVKLYFLSFTGSDLFPVSDHCMLQHLSQKLHGVNATVSGLEHRHGFSSVDTLITFGSHR